MIIQSSYLIYIHRQQTRLRFKLLHFRSFHSLAQRQISLDVILRSKFFLQVREKSLKSMRQIASEYGQF